MAVRAAAAAVPAAIVLNSPAGFDLGIGRTIIACAAAAPGWLGGLFRTGHPLSAEITAACRGRARSLSRNAA